MEAKPKIKTYNRRLRSEVVRFNGMPVKFYRRGSKWHWRAIGGKVKVERET